MDRINLRIGLRALAALAAAVALPLAALAQAPDPDIPLAPEIRLNQIGFYPGGPKVAIIAANAAGAFHVTSPTLADTFFTGTLSSPQFWVFSGETVTQADFSDFGTPGTYVLTVPGIGTSHPFEIAEYVLRDVIRGAIKGLYFQRAGVPLLTEHAGVWARPAGHPSDTEAVVHPAAATEAHPANSRIDVSGGWYDAGDYGKYVPPGATSIWHLLQAHESFPDYFATLETNIPESGNGVPDILDEALFELRWFFRMQEEDGGVFVMVKNTSHEPFVMPHEDRNTRYVAPKTTAATLSVAAAMAKASRVFRAFDEQLPGLVDSARTAALDAWNWARTNPGARFDQSRINAFFDPDYGVGAYDSDPLDQYVWAGLELWLTTAADSFVTNEVVQRGLREDDNGLGGAEMNGYISAAAGKRPSTVFQVQDALQRMSGMAGYFKTSFPDTPYRIGFFGEDWQFTWGSNGYLATASTVMLHYHLLAGNRSYLEAPLHNLDWVLGRNAVGYSFMTGFGDKVPVEIHHRPSQSDDVEAPNPGLLAGGPFVGAADHGSCPSGTFSGRVATRYIDDNCSWSTNEITIYWNSYFIHQAGAVEVLFSEGPIPNDGAGPGREGARTLPPPYPNPFQTSTLIAYGLAAAEHVRLEVFDALGRRVALLVDEEQPAGQHDVRFEAAGLNSGPYFCRLQVGDVSDTRMVVLVR